MVLKFISISLPLRAESFYISLFSLNRHRQNLFFKCFFFQIRITILVCTVKIRLTSFATFLQVVAHLRLRLKVFYLYSNLDGSRGLRLPHTSRYFVSRQKIFTCRVVCGEFRQVCDKIGACRAISDSARSQNVLSGFVG